MDKQKMSIAILGTRGIPNRYGGFEACAEELGLRLAERGHQVSVYCVHDHPVQDTDWNGISRVLIHNPENKFGTAGQFVYDLNCNKHTIKENFDIVLHLGYTSDSIWQKRWAQNSIHIVNMDGQEWQRQKYNKITRRFLKYAEKLATRRAKALVADSPVIKEYLQQQYENPVYEIAYGAEIPADFSPKMLEQYHVKENKYDMILARMEPENNIGPAIKAKINCGDDIPLLIVGNNNKYSEHLQQKYGSNKMIRFCGPIYDKEHINSLRHYSRYYIHGHSVGGTNPSLLEAMACSATIVAHGNPFNKAVLNENGYYFQDEFELADILSEHMVPEIVKWKEENLKKIRNIYNWDLIADAYENLFKDAINT